MTDYSAEPAVLLVEDFVPEHAALFAGLQASTLWDQRMQARLTASFGLPYNYAGMEYPAQQMPPALLEVCSRIEGRLAFLPNNCLANYYPDGRSKMGFHADDVEVLAEATGVVVISLGATRPLRFRRKDNPEVRYELRQAPGSLLYLPQAVHREWVHAIPRVPRAEPRISLTFRRLRSS